MPYMVCPYDFGLRVGDKPNTVEVVDTRNGRVAFVLEYVYVEDMETERSWGETVIKLRISGRLAVIEAKQAK